MMNLKINRVTLAIAAFMGVISTSVWSAKISGPGNSQTLDGQSAQTAWIVSDQGTLIILPGGKTTTVTVTDGYLEAQGGVISDMLTVQGRSDITISDSVLSSASRQALKVFYGVGSGDSAAVITNSALQGSGAGASLGGNGTVLTFNHSSVSASSLGGTSALKSGTGIINFGGTLNVLNGSSVTGESNGLILQMDDDFSSVVNVNIDNSTVTGKGDSAIKVTVYGDSTLANINVANGSSLSGGNGYILDVNKTAEANLTVDNSQLMGNIINRDRGTTNITLDNHASLTGTLTNVTTATIGDNAGWIVPGDSSVGFLSNAGTIAFSEDDVSRILTVEHYQGNDGLIVFNGELNGDDSLTDKLIVTGDTEGTTRVRVNNLGGKGEQTVDGIELIKVEGDSSGVFVQEGRIVAGAYDYHLARGSNVDANWYLTNKIHQDDDNGGDDDDHHGDEHGNGGDHNGGGGNSGEDSRNDRQVMRPEGGAYSANLAAANNMFILTLADRQGETEYTDPLTGEKKLTSLWLKNTGSHTRSHDDSGQLTTQANSYILMLGGDIAMGVSSNGGSWRIGGLMGYGNSKSNTHSTLTSYRATGQIEGYTAGLYSTWYASGSDRDGLYVDTLLQHSWFTNRVNGEDLPEERYDSRALQASLESGYVVKLSESERNSWYLQPHAQVSWTRMYGASHREKNGTLVETSSDNNVRTRMGMKVFAEGFSHFDDGRNRKFRPFAETNWIHNTQENGVKMDDIAIIQKGSRNIAEMKLGVEGKLTSQFNITGALSQQVGNNSYSNTAASLGIKYSF